MSEKKLQAQMVIGFSQEFPERRGDLIGTFNETVNAAQGANRLSLGLIKGLSDLIWINSEKKFVAIEVKYPGTNHSLVHILEQCRFIRHNAYSGFFCTSVDSFFDIVRSDGESGGLTVEDVLSMCVLKMEKKISNLNYACIDDLLFEAHLWEKKSGKKMPKIKF